MSLIQSLVGILRVEVISADITGMLDQLCKNGIQLWNLTYQNELTVSFCISRSTYKNVSFILSNRGDVLEIKNHEGIFWSFQSLLFRPVLVLGVISFLFAVLFLPGRVFFVQVEGNSVVCTNEILEKAAELDVKFGATRRYVKSEEVKNRLLSSLEELEWAGVNTKGCVAIISVREHSVQDTDTSIRGVGDVIALRDGVVLSCDVIRGNGVCVPGQAVKTGDILISGTVDHGIAVISTAAEGEVYAATRREISVLTSANAQIRGDEQGRSTKFRLQIGKKLINFFKGSGISGVTCVKMYSKYVLTLPGGFELPLALVRETQIDSVLSEEILDEQDARKLLSDFASDYTRKQMIAGRILISHEQWVRSGDFYQLTGNYACTEMIGRAQQEQIGAYHGKTD